jgi:hypothetical protein
MLHPGSPWLFPTRSRDGSRIIATPTWKETTLPSETGHLLRHVHRTVAQSIGLNVIDAALLLDHSLPGINRVYVHQEALFGRLLKAQERMSREILRLLGAESPGPSDG